jgi:hypothetical protein
LRQRHGNGRAQSTRRSRYQGCLSVELEIVEYQNRSILSTSDRRSARRANKTENTLRARGHATAAQACCTTGSHSRYPVLKRLRKP